MKRIAICIVLLAVVACSPSGPEQIHLRACPDGQQPLHIAAVDLNGDDIDQLVVSCAGTQHGALRVFSVDKQGALKSGQTMHFDHGVIGTAAWPRVDGREDLVIAGSTPRERSLHYTQLDEAGQLTEPVQIHSGLGEITQMVISDVDGDGNPDIVMPGIDVWLENSGSDGRPGPFRSQPIEPGIEWRRVFGRMGHRAEQARPAGTYIRQEHQSVRVFSRIGIEDFAIGMETERLFEVLAAGDLNGDGIPDLVVTVQSAPVENRLHFLLSSDSEHWQLTGQIGDLLNPASVILDDYDGDGRTDLLMAPIAMPDQEKYSLRLVSGISGEDHDGAREIPVSGFPYRMIPIRIGSGAPAVAFIDQVENRFNVLRW